MSPPPHLVAAWIGLLAATVTDATTGRIPNWLTGSMMMVGIGTHVALGPDPWFGVVGAAGAFAVHFLLWAIGVIKAGDAKLMMGLGACVGAFEMLEATLWWLILFLPLGLVILAVRGKLGNLWATMRYLVDRARGAPTDKPPESITIVGPLLALCGFLATTTDWLEGVMR